MSATARPVPHPRTAVKVGDTVVCWIAVLPFDPSPRFAAKLRVYEKDAYHGVTVKLGAEKRPELIRWRSIIAKVSMNRKRVSVANGKMVGRFLVFANHPYRPAPSSP